MELDLKKLKLRLINETLQNLDRKKNERDFKIINPEGSHALCAGGWSRQSGSWLPR